MRETADITIKDATGAHGFAESVASAANIIKCRVRVSARNYLSALFVLTFAAALLNNLNLVWGGLILAAAAWSVIPILFWFDRVEFDGKYLKRKGFVAFLQKIGGAGSRRLKISEIERIETQSLRTLRRGGRVYYRYSSEIRGNGLTFPIASGGKSYRHMAQTLFPLIADEKLDARSGELRDFLCEPNSLISKTGALKLPSSEVLDNTLPKLRRAHWQRESRRNFQFDADDRESIVLIEDLRRAANELRIAGNLSQSMEAFRRAFLRQPDNAEMLHEFARGLYSYAAAARSAAWKRRAKAALRLAARRGSANAALLSRIGESYLQFGSYDEAQRVLRASLALHSENYRAECGLGGIALHEGKIAHVVHHFQAAARITDDSAAERWARNEAEYFGHLNTDGDYLENEVGRLNWLKHIAQGKRISQRLTFSGLALIIGGFLIDDNAAALGWALAAVTVLAWTGLTLAAKILAERSSFESLSE